MPVALGAGIAVYFQWPTEPTAVWPAAIAVACGAAAVWARQRPGLCLTLLATGLMLAGIVLGALRTAAVDTPLWDDRPWRGTIAGTVETVEFLGDRARITLVDLPSDVGDGRATVRVRLRLVPADAPPAIGDRVSVFGQLTGPRRPVAPGAFDFRRWAYFQGLSATGFAMGHLSILDQGADGGFAAGLSQLRTGMAARIDASLPPLQAGFATALLTGQRGGISDTTYDTLRDAGLAHLLAISGLHVGLVAGGVFVLLRLLGSLHEGLALRAPVKKAAAVAAMAAAVGYMLVVGAPVPTQRAVIMTGLVLLAVLVDRNAISMRLAAWAGVGVLLVAPESLVSASFQMSFAAVVALIAAYETLAGPMGRWRRRGGIVRRIVAYGAGVLISTAVAGAATAPFSVFHFQTVALAGTLANLLAVPLTAFWIMPFGMAAYLAMPLGLESLPLTAMGWGIEALVWIAGQASALGGGSARVAAPQGWWLATITLGGLWLCLWRGRLRMLGGLAIAIAIMVPDPGVRPGVIVAESARLVGLSDDAPPILAITETSGDRFTRQAWADRYAADLRPLSDWPAATHRCDSIGCVVQAPQLHFSLPNDPRAVADDCLRVDLVIAPFPVRHACGATVIDRFDVWRYGAHALWITSDGLTIETVADRVGRRPWSLVR